MSFQFSIAGGTGVVVVGARAGAEDDFGGGGGRLEVLRVVLILVDKAGSGGIDCSVLPFGLDFLSQPVNEDCTIVGGSGFS